MKRRSFFKYGASAAALPLVGSMALAKNLEGLSSAQQQTFNLNYAPHFGLFEQSAGKDVLDQIQFMYDQGFRSLEDNEMKQRPLAEQEKIANKMAALDMQMGVFVANTITWNKPGLVTGKKEFVDQFIKDLKDSVAVAKRVNTKWMTVVPGYIDLSLEMGYQTGNLIEALRRGCEVLEPHGLVIVLEPLNWWANHAGQFLTKIPQAYEICKAVNSPSCKILFDIYHQQISEGNIIPNIDKAWSEIAYFQIGDNPGRNEPTTGEINYRNIFQHIHKKGYKGILGMEHGKSQDGKAGEQKVIDAYRITDDF